ncbi:MAG TPA: trypsin-like peptidase domain-containing protein [Pseudonocardiaceae bacterium]|nr:trypsin-like peptidase domain-containing protein [Pseudonocardiaceae bacterium]
MTTPTSPTPESIGPGSLDAAIVRIFTATGSPAGLGFLVTDQLALTCAHVVTAALDTPPDGPPPAGATIAVDLPLGSAQATTATVEQWIPARDSGAGDIAVLRLAAPPAGAQPVRLVDEDDVWGHSARAYGLPDGYPGGVWHSAVLRHRQGNGWVQADLVGEGYQVSPGFSGGPVWDDELAGVVGMVALAEAGRPPVSYLIPTSGLRSAWPGLRELVAPPSPFRGLRPFRESDVAIFHGRDAESDEVAAIVAEQQWTTLIGSSGCGKSSLAMAGVVPRRRAAGDCPVVMRPGHHTSPLRALAAELVPLLEPGLGEIDRLGRTSTLAAELAEHGLAEVLPRILELTGAQRLLVVVDQFEELLDVPAAAVDELAGVLFGEDLPATVRVLSTLRADFLEPVLAHTRLGPVVSTRVATLAPMRPDQLYGIITTPVENTPGVRYEPNLPERILADAGTEPSALPLLGFALDLLWARQISDQGVLTHHAYEQIRGVSGALGDYAERAWADTIPAADEPAATRLLTRLVRVPIGVAAATRRIAPRAELGEPEWRIAQRLAATRLLVLKGGEGKETVELAHEALITGWDRLARRITADRSFLDWRESLRHDLNRWQRGGGPADLLPSSRAMAVARHWIADRGADLTASERDYLDQGERHWRRQSRRRRAWFTGLVIVVVAALVFGSLFAYAQRQSSENQALANSRALAQAAQDNADYDPALSVMTAMAAYQASPTQEARNQLLREYLEQTGTTHLLSGMSGKIAAFRTSRDGNVVLAATDLGRATLYVHATNGTMRSEPVADGQYVSYVLVTPDGRRAAFVEDDGTAGWFDVDPDAAQPAGKVHLLPPVSGLVAKTPYTDTAMAISADGKLLAVQTEDGLEWWNLDADTIAGTVPAPANIGIGMWFAPGDRTLLVRIDDYSGSDQLTGLVAVDLPTGAVRTVLAPAVDQDFLVSGDRSAIAVCREQSDGTSVLQLQRVSDGTPEGTPYRTTDLMCDDLDLNAIDTTGHRVVVNVNALTLVDLDHGTSIGTTTKPDTISGYTTDLISTGGTPLLAGYGDAQITYTQLRSGPAGAEVGDQQLSADGKSTITLFKDGSLQRRPAGVNSDRLLAGAPGPQQPWSDLGERNYLAQNRDRSLVADQENVNVVVVRQTSDLRTTARIVTTMPPVGDQVGDLDPKDHFQYFFDWTGRLVTVAGSQIQQWDPRTGRLLAHVDFGPLLRAAGDVVSADPIPSVAPYPAPDEVSVLQFGDPVVRIVSLATGRVVSTLPTASDATTVRFDSTAGYFALLRQSSIIELWQNDPPRRELGPFHSVSDIGLTPSTGRFLNDSGRYALAANDSIHIYQVGRQTPVDTYEFGHPDGSQSQNPYSFRDISADGSTVVYADQNGNGGALVLDPAVWTRDLCRIIGNRAFTADELASLPAAVRTPQVCAAG